MIGDDGDVDDDGGHDHYNDEDGGHDHYNDEDDIDGDVDDGGDIPLEFLPDCQTTASASLPLLCCYVSL